MLTTCIIFAEMPGARVELCGVAVLERLLRTLERGGFPRAKIRFAPDKTENENVLALRGAMVFDERLIERLKFADLPLALFERGRFCGAAAVPNEWLRDSLEATIAGKQIAKFDIESLPAYSTKLRRDLAPFCFCASQHGKKKAERILLDAAQKGTLDLPAIIHAPIENFFVARLWKTSITPNQLTIFSNVVAWCATFCFATNRLIFATVLALIVGILDGLDGKLARVKVETSPAGKLEHWFDALFEISWWLALAFALHRSAELPNAFAYFFLLMGAEAIDGIAKASVIATHKKLIDEISAFDRFVRLFGGRRNIYVWIFAVGLLCGAPAKAFVVMAWWEVVTAAVHLPRALWLRFFAARR